MNEIEQVLDQWESLLISLGELLQVQAPHEQVVDAWLLRSIQ